MEQTPNTKTPDLLDTTDSLEAIDAIRWMKNFLFVIILLCLLTSGAVFCLERFDHLDRTTCMTCDVCSSGPCTSECKMIPQPATAPAVKTENEIRTAAQSVTAESKTVEIKAAPADPNAKTPRPLPAFLRYKPRCQAVAVVLKISNFIFVLTAAMYCLTLLMGLKISLTGRLGGINHISRAFFISLFALVITLPWQTLLPGVIVGAIFTPGELLCQWHTTVQGSTFWLVICYLRFAGLWLVALLLFTWAQIRSGKWSRATLRRLGLVR
jgi:hypothetical protein